MIGTDYKTSCGGKRFDVYTVHDERRFLKHLGTPALGVPTMSRMDYLLAYQASLKSRVHFDAALPKALMQKCVSEAIDAERGKRVVIPEQAHIGSGMTINRVNGDSP